MSSEYGNPPVTITTPEVLKRGEMELSDEVREMMVGSQTFLYGDFSDNYFIALTTMKFNQGTEFKLDTAVDGVYDLLEKRGASNIILKQEEFSTLNGATGMKIFGSMSVENPQSGKVREKEYVILNFGEGLGFQQIILIHNANDEFAREITDRIVGSVELINTPNNVQ